MYLEKTIGIVVPCYDVSHLIEKVIDDMPSFVDHIVCIDDCSNDSTKELIAKKAALDSRVILLEHHENQGVGGAIASGYIWTRDQKIDVSVVMAGDGQMDPADLENIIKPVALGEVDYTKGNRFFNPDVLRKMPKVRFFGNIALSFLTKIASGYWHIADTQSGYTAVSLKVLETIDPDKIYKRYGMPNDFLTTLNIFDFSVKDIPINPVYDIGEISGIRIRKVLFSISFLLVVLFLKRMLLKYVYKSFHPLVLLYLYGFPSFLLGTGAGLLIMIIDQFVPDLSVGYGWMLFFAMLSISGYFSIVIAMFMDMQHNMKIDKS